jgi:hypothetical protein
VSLTRASCCLPLRCPWLQFDVHRNWLRITATRPLSKWYFDSASEWTLDYPPFFAYFEKSLAFLSSFFDPSIASARQVAWQDVAFQRASVIATEGLLFYACTRLLAKLYPQARKSAAFVILCAIFLHPALILVDHIHFQYNGMLFGVLFMSLAAAQEVCFDCCAAVMKSHRSRRSSIASLPCGSLCSSTSSTSLSTLLSLWASTCSEAFAFTKVRQLAHHKPRWNLSQADSRRTISGNWRSSLYWSVCCRSGLFWPFPACLVSAKSSPGCSPSSAD